MKAKRYRIETDAPAPQAVDGTAAQAVGSDARIGEILETVNALRAMIYPPEQVVREAVEACRRDIHEVFTLRTELDAMKEAITSTKLEIATLHRSDHEGKGMRRVAGELDAVVEATERATTTILSALEDIETHASCIKAAKKGNSADVEAILERTVVMYEACNFQDLTGQRIGKIVGVLKFVEERLDRMIDVWGGLDAFKGLDGLPAAEPVDPDRALLNGPKLDEDPGHVDQSDIDALFD
jgi:chemotaxis protein CheZ